MYKNLIRKVRVQTIHLKACGLHDLTPSNLSIIFAPHPDDEVFGCCGLMQRLIAQGKRVKLIIMTGGGKSHAGCCDIDESELIRQRRQLTIRAAKEYGLSQEHIYFLDYPDGGVLESDYQTEKLSCLLHKRVDGQDDVSVFYPHKKGEGWSDHVTTSNIVSHLFDKICPNVKQYEYCVWFWFYNCWKIDWNQACLVRMNKNEHAVKLKAIEAYIEPKAPCGKPWSGVLPLVFLWANKWDKELYFRVK